MLFMLFGTLAFTLPGTMTSGTVLRLQQGALIPDQCLLDVSVQLDNVANLTAFSVRLTFDPAVVQVVEVTNGGFLVDEAPAPSNGFDNAAGSVKFGMYLVRSEGDDNPPESGSRELVHLRVLALKTDTSMGMVIDPEETKLVEFSTNQPIPYSLGAMEMRTGDCAAKQVFLPLIER